MKTQKLSTAFALLISLNSATAFADKQEVIQSTRSAGTFFGSAAVGAAAGGPIGFFVGGIAGALLSEKFNQHDERTTELTESKMNMNIMSDEIEIKDLEIAKLEKMIEEKMQFQMYFDTGEDSLSKEDVKQLEALSDFLTENTYMHVGVDGHSDARGTEEYNQILSEHRAHAVAEILTGNGIEAERISTRGYGADFSGGISGDMDTYAKERKVKVEVFPSEKSAEIAGIE